MSPNKILVTGANGQLGKEFRRLEAQHPNFKFIFAGHSDLPIEDSTAVENFFQLHHPFVCVNCAAYTAVDKAESEKEIAHSINAEAVGVLATACRNADTQFIHISTDYVFDGGSSIPYKEDDVTAPINHYGITKLMGEQLALKNDPSSIIIRTSWVYSEYGNNFVKTMIRLMKERESIYVVSDQVGSPTYAADLAGAIMKMISLIVDRWSLIAGQFPGFDEIMSTEAFSTSGHLGSPAIDQRPSALETGIFNYSNEGEISWYEFALAIKELIGSSCKVNPIPTSQYPTLARRPRYSLLNKTKIKTAYGLVIPQWRESLARCIERL